MNLPKRTADTMSDAIALSSPCGRMSKRARKAAQDRLAVALFGEGGMTREALQGGPGPQRSERERHLAQAAQLRHLANLGMCTRKYNREADRLEALAEALQ